MSLCEALPLFWMTLVTFRSHNCKIDKRAKPLLQKNLLWYIMSIWNWYCILMDWIRHNFSIKSIVQCQNLTQYSYEPQLVCASLLHTLKERDWDSYSAVKAGSSAGQPPELRCRALPSTSADSVWNKNLYFVIWAAKKNYTCMYASIHVCKYVCMSI